MAKPEALGKIRVLECGHGGLQVNAMQGGGYLGELGANVIMVEPPGGSPLRKLTAFGRKRYMFKDDVNGDLCGGTFLHECRNKQSITLDLTQAAGREILKKLVVHADVLVENYAPGQFDEWGIGYRQLSQINPRLIYVWTGQKGQWGPLKDQAGRTLSLLALFLRLVSRHRAAQELRRHPHPRPASGPTTSWPAT